MRTVLLALAVAGCNVRATVGSEPDRYNEPCRDESKLLRDVANEFRCSNRLHHMEIQPGNIALCKCIAETGDR